MKVPQNNCLIVDCRGVPCATLLIDFEVLHFSAKNNDVYDCLDRSDEEEGVGLMKKTVNVSQLVPDFQYENVTDLTGKNPPKNNFITYFT